MSTVNLYVDTNINGVGKKKGKYIYLLETETSKGPATVYDIKEVEATKDVAEIEAIVAAVKRLNPNSCTELNIYVTSRMLMTNLNDYLSRWAAHNFLGANGKRLSRWEDWQTIYENTQKIHMRAYNNTHSYSKWLLKQL